MGSQKLRRMNTSASVQVEQGGGLDFNLEQLVCNDHRLAITHVCRVPSCPYVFMCPECFRCNEKHMLEHKPSIALKHWVN
jgi:hypothetical protein